MHTAFKGGRSSDDPTMSWLKSELDFFDNYAIPLAMQLKDCDAFVVNQDEFLNYALKNRQQLSSHGEDMVKSMIEHAKEEEQGDQTEPEKLVFNETQELDNLTSEGKVSKHLQHLIDWNVEMLTMLVKQIVAKNNAVGGSGNKESVTLELDSGVKIVDEISDVICFPKFDAATSSRTCWTPQ